MVDNSMDHQAPDAPGASPTHRQRLQQAVDRYHRPLVSYARSWTGDLQRAQDAAQDTLLRLCQQPPAEFEAYIEPRLAAWLFTVCRNRVIDLHRKERRMTATDTHGIDQAQAAPTTDPAAEADAHDQQDHLLALVAALPTGQREVVRLRFDASLSYKEIAEVTGHSVSHVGVLLHEAIKQLRTEMTQLTA